ncbi:thrombospondin type-1 domain-containing protein 4-like isoform X2 [Pristis pectinata]|uniref:thrombospondin type-1 domain-containing protein 4-like isoform X2 n=1 Tax=Pristis pectinata TaxID=685728 RepID=UPI00223D570E|nr:thrombospondin type-1 domain-containing protein 4-like isoform X2 [Pristis pectinata]
MRDGQRWMCRFCWLSAIVGFQLLTILQCSLVHRKVPQRRARQVPGPQEPGDVVPGVWSSWGPWSPCSSSCGVGVVQQSRRCLPPEQVVHPWALPQEPAVPGWTLQPRGSSPQPQGSSPQPLGRRQWPPYPGRSVSALKPTYSLHVDSEPSTFARGESMPLSAQQDPSGGRAGVASNHLSLPLYGDDLARGWPESRASRGPANEEQRYRHLSNRGSVPLYRQGQPTNHHGHPANQNPASPYGVPALTNREFSPLYAPEGSTNQGSGSGSQSRQRSTPYWRGTTANRRSLWVRQELRSANRSRSRSTIRPGLYGYGKVPADFQLRGSGSPLQHPRQGHHAFSNPPEVPPRASWEERRRERRGVRAEDRSQRQGEPQAWGQRSADGPPNWPNQTLWSRQPLQKKGGLFLGPSLSEAPVPEDDPRVGHRPLDPDGWAQLGRSPEEAAMDPDASRAGDVWGPRPRVRRHAHLGPGWRSQSREPEDTGVRARGRRGQEERTKTSPQTSAGEPPNPAEPADGPLTLHQDPRLSRETTRANHQGHGEAPANHSPASRRPRRQDLGVTTQPWGESHGREWDPYQMASATCPGLSTQYKSCTSLACPSGTSDPRREQCASFNHQQFMGRYYEWEPFTEVRKEQRCELNCRPAGYRFYVRHADRVLDGTPCEANSSDVCVGGQCLTAGCDGTLGSGAKLDKCGVCGGDESACKVVFGTFEDSQVNVGYHKIIEIPTGATKINVTEMGRSRNYLALRSRSGRSIINGNWAIDRPGKYDAAGTMFVYQRPTETSGESFFAEGPTTEALDVYMIFQQDNPGIHYQFILPVENAAPPVQEPPPPSHSYGSWTPVDRREVSALGSGPTLTHQGNSRTPRVRGGQRDRRLQVYHSPAQEDPARARPGYRWKSLSSTECSVSCGKGFQFPVYRCVTLGTQEVVDDGHCDEASKPARVEEPCNTQPCPAFWSVGSWSACSRTCGEGTYHRQVLCRQAYANRTVAVHPHRCRHLEKPNATQPCQARPCTHWQIQTDWESCSVPCGVGQRKRSIRCVSNQGDVVGEAECNGKQKPTDSEACDMGPCVQAWFYTDWGSQCSVECGVGVQRRTVLCLTNNVKDESPGHCEGPRPPDARACTREHCQRQVRWFTSPWNQCPVECGNGTQNRDLICVTKSGTEWKVTDAADCAHLDKPATAQPCSAGPCGPRWFTTGWGQCSKSCMGGVQKRDVRCLDHAGYPSSRCRDAGKPVGERVCHTHPCMPELDANCKDSYYNCAVVVQARLCVYSYYKMVCCASCTHAERRAKGQRPGTSGRRAGA